MDTKKRKAELQLTAESVEESNNPPQQTEGTNSESKEEQAVPVAGGFSSYAKSNPFAAAIANGQNKGGFGSGFGGFSAARTSVAMPPPLTLPSPKSPKANPFSSPSPAHNPFMTIVENNDDLWRSMANDKLTADDLAKTNSFGEVKDKKSPAFRGVFFGGNGHSSFGSVAASSLASGATTASIFGSSGPSQSTAAADDGDDDAGDEDNEGDDAEDSPAANHASMKIISLPENVKLVTGEEDDECLFQVRAKMFRLNAGTSASGNGAAHDDTSVTVAAKEASEQESGVCEEKGALDASDVLSAMEKARAAKGNNKPTTVRAEWVEVGIGPLKILCRKSQTGVRSGGRLVMRREEKQGGQGTKLLLNARLDRFLTVSRQNDKMVQVVCVNHAEVPLPGASSSSTVKIGTYLLKTKTSDEADDMYSIIHDFVSRAKESEGNAASSPAAIDSQEQAQGPNGSTAQESETADHTRSPSPVAVTLA